MHPLLEPRTLLLVQAGSLGLLALMLWASRREVDRLNGLGLWSGAISLQAAGALLLAFAPVAPGSVLTLGSGFAAAGAALMVAALRRFSGQASAARTVVLGVTAAAAAGAFASGSPLGATLFDGIGFGGLALLNAWTLWPAPQGLKANPYAGGALRVQRIVVACDALMGFVLPLRAAASLVYGGPGHPALPADWEVIGIAGPFAGFMAARLGFVLLCMRRAEAEARLNALTDDLTTLGNRRALDDAMTRALAAATRHGTVFSIVMADVDQLRTINTTHGHRAGDAALRTCATRLLGTIRAEDRAFRHGGDTFCVLMPATEAAGALTAAQRWRTRLSAPATPALHALSACFGVTSWRPGDDADALFGRADDALARAKAIGRDRVEAS